MVLWNDPQRPRWWQHTRSLLVLAVIAGSILTQRHPSWWGAGLAATALVAVCVVSRLPWIFRSEYSRLLSILLVVNGVASVLLSLVVPDSAALAFTAMSVASAVIAWTIPVAVAYAVGLVVVYSTGQLARGSSPTVVLVGLAAIGAGVLLGVVRRQSNELTAQAARAHEEHAHAAALDERSRIAREIHDVLAHSLAALTVQLETADALLESGRPDQAHTSVLRAGKLAREGLAETRRAIGALRGDTLPLPDLLTTLADAYGTDHVAAATVRVDGVPRDLRPDVALALYRTAQEAITNVRKHAPGAPIEVRLHYGTADVELAVTNGPGGGERPLAGTGGGYGLTGLRERAELTGGTIEAGPIAAGPIDAGPIGAGMIGGGPTDGGPHGAGWRVDVRIPA